MTLKELLGFICIVFFFAIPTAYIVWVWNPSLKVIMIKMIKTEVVIFLVSLLVFNLMDDD